MIGDTDITDVPMYLRARKLRHQLPAAGGLRSSANSPSKKTSWPCWRPRRAAHGERREQDGKPARRNSVLDTSARTGVRAVRRRTPPGGDRARAVHSAQFILLDEPSAGSIPLRCSICRRSSPPSKQSGIGILITDHNVRETLTVTDRAYIINEGRIFRAGNAGQLGNDPEVKRVYLGESFCLV